MNPMSGKGWRRIITGLVAIAGIVLLASCGGGSEKVSNTGYNGAWFRGNDYLSATLFIWFDGEEYRFRMSQVAADGSGGIECDWNGTCEEFVDGEKMSDLQFTLRKDGSTGLLFLHCDGHVIRPKELVIDYTHRLELSPDGLTMTSYTVQSQGVAFEPARQGKRILKKISDKVPDPPSPRADHGS